MALIKLLIFDEDDEYSLNLCNYLTHHYSEILLVNWCSNSYNIKQWIEKIDPDIVLTSEKYYKQMADYFHKEIVLLSPVKSLKLISESKSIYKFKDANQIAGEIINSYTAKGNDIHLIKERASKVITVYSASGNAGKTSLALAISSICSFSGKSVFYLNLEQFQSTGIFFSGIGEYSISEVIYYVKQREKSLSSKIHMMASKDIDSGIYYFSQADNVFSTKELLPPDIESLINAIKECGHFDLILVDTDSLLNDSMVKLFDLSDEILYLLTSDPICLHKTKMFIDSINKLSKYNDLSSDLTHKLRYVANKVSQQVLRSEKSFQDQNMNITSFINYDPDFPSLDKLAQLSGGSTTINNLLKDIAKRYL
jgi:cellulose biosynthesis protein BcsQ